MNESTLYRELAKKMNFQVGDIVRVLRKAKDYELGWGVGWTQKMDKAIGHKFSVVSEDRGDGISLMTCERSYNFPCFVLELLIEKPKKIVVRIDEECFATITRDGIIIECDGVEFSLPSKILDEIIEAKEVLS